MKAVVTILFFLDTFALAMLSLVFLRLLDHNGTGVQLFETGFGILASIAFMIYLVYRYLNGSTSAKR